MGVVGFLASRVQREFCSLASAETVKETKDQRGLIQEQSVCWKPSDRQDVCGSPQEMWKTLWKLCWNLTGHLKKLFPALGHEGRKNIPGAGEKPGG